MFTGILLLYVAVCCTFSCPNSQPSNSHSHRHYQVFKADRHGANKNSYEALKEDLNCVQSSSDLKVFLEKRVKWNVTIQLVPRSNTTNQSLECTGFLTTPEERSRSLESNLFSSFEQICAEKCDNDDVKGGVENRNSDDDNNTDDDKAERNCSNDGCNCNDDVERNSDNHIRRMYGVLVAMGIISLLGNGVAIMYEIRTLTKRSTRKTKEEKTYNILVLNLCFADLLMGIYLIILALSYLNHSNRVNFNLCNALGIISTLSIQVSMSVLVIISAYRLYSVLYPFKSIRIKVAVILMVLIWIVWLVVAIIPVFDETLFAHKFTRAVLAYPIPDPKDEEIRCMSPTAKFPVHSIINSVEVLAKASIPNDTLFSRVISQSNKHQTNDVMVQLLTSFNLVDLEKSRIEFLGYYTSDRGCSIDIFFAAEDGYNAFFSLVLLSCSITGYLFIAIVYSLIFKNISTSELKSFFPCVSKNFSFKKRKELPQTQTRVDEDRQIFVRIFVIVVTDVIFGIFVCFVGLGYFIYTLTDPNCFLERMKFKDLAKTLTLMMFSLNSVINPYIYSSHLWRKVCCCCKK